MNQHNHISIVQWLPAIMSCLAAVLLGGCLAFDDAFLFLYPESEALQVLYAKTSVGETHLVLQEHFLDCYQSINLLVAGLLIPALWLHLPPFSALWLWQTVFNTLLLFRAGQWLQQKEPQQTYLFYGLLYGNPFLWYALMLMPSQVILAWLVIEWLLCKNQNTVVSFISVLAISFCGSMGWVIALLICVTTWLQPYFFSTSSATKSIWLWIAALPSTALYAVQSINAQTVAGAYLVNAPSPLVEWMQFSWLTFQAHENINYFLFWLGNGGAQWLKPLPLFGIFAITGLFQHGIAKQFTVAFCVTVLTLLLSFLLFVPVIQDTTIQSSLVLIILLIPFTAQGITTLALSIPKCQIEAAWGLALLVLFLGWFRQPFVWSASRTHAELLHDMSQNIYTVLDTNTKQEHSVVALPFHSTLLSSLDNTIQIIPLHMAVQKEILMLQDSLSGFRMTIMQALPLQPEFIFFYPEQVLPQEQLEHALHILPFIQTELELQYDPHQLKQLVYHQRKANQTPLKQPSHFIEPSHSSWFLSEVVQEHSGFKRYEIQLVQALQNHGNQFWDMEHTFAHAQSTGFAFGSSPKRHISAVGSGAAVSGKGEDRRLIGTLQSDPFVIQGDELQFYANLPQDASPTIICLAVQQKIADYNENEPPRLEHIFDHPLHEPLVGSTHYYIKPEELHYEQDGIYGWKVVRVLHGSGVPGWQFINWSMIPWKNKQAVWLAADRDRRSWLAIDHIVQTDRPPGLYWDFEFGIYDGWITEDDAFGVAPAFSPFGSQIPISGYEGNYFINSFYEGSDEYTGYLHSPPFTIQHNRLTFLVGGGEDINQVYVALNVEGQSVLRATGSQSETLALIEWDITDWIGKSAQITVADQAQGAWGHILADEFRMFSLKSN